MLQINGKTFMNLQEAVQWLLDNNALPYQSSANYIANTEIGLGTITNPSPAKVRIGSLIFFADSKVSTVTGLTENGFIVSDQYNDLVDDVVYVSNVALDASNHLKVTLSNGTVIDAGQINAVTSFTIDASQHLIVSYINGTTQDLGSLGDYSNVDFIAKTLEQTNANWKGSNINFGAPTGLSITNTYNRLEVINQVLYCVVNFKIENNSGSAKTFSGVDLATGLPSPYSEKVIDVLGDSVHDVSQNYYVFITGEPCLAQKNSSSYDGVKYPAKLYIVNRNYIDQLSVFVEMDSPLSLDDGDYVFVTGRIALTLL